jgi:hypothetical protein
VLFLAGVAAGVAVWRSAQPGRAAYRVSLQAVPTAESADWSVAGSVCPEGGRGPGPIGADDTLARSIAGGSRAQQVGGGQLIAYLLRFEADPIAPPAAALGADITFRTASPTSPADLGTGVVCAFVDETDPLTTSVNATAALTRNEANAQGKQVVSSVEIADLEPGTSAVVEVWLRATGDQPRSTATVDARVSRVAAPGGARARVLVPEARLLTSSQQSREVDLELSGPDGADLQPGQQVLLTLRLRNRGVDLAHDVVARLVPDAALRIDEVEVHDDAGMRTECAEAVGSLTCTAAYLVPAERVTIDVTATIGEDAPQVFTGSGEGCRQNGQDLCARAELIGLAGGPWQGGRSELAIDLPAPNVIGGTKTTVNGETGLYVGRHADFQYVVALGGTEAVQGVKVTDPACAPVRLVSGDDGADGVLRPGERWTYRCSALVDRSQLEDVSITATTTAGEPVVALARLATPVLDPQISVATSGTANAPAVEVVNSGDAELRGVVLDGRECERTVDRGDADEDGILDPGERWMFPCRVASGSVRVYGTDPAGGAVTAALGP